LWKIKVKPGNFKVYYGDGREEEESRDGKERSGIK